MADAETKKPRRSPYRNQIYYAITRNSINMKMHDSRSYTNAKTIFDHESVIAKINFTLNFDRKIQQRKKIINTDPNTGSKYKTLLHDKIGQTKTHKSKNLRQTDRSDKKIS